MLGSHIGRYWDLFAIILAGNQSQAVSLWHRNQHAINMILTINVITYSHLANQIKPYKYYCKFKVTCYVIKDCFSS